MRESYDHGPSMIKQPHYIGLEEARQLLAQMGVQLTLRQKCSAPRSKMPRDAASYPSSSIRSKLKIEKDDLISIYFKRQVKAQSNLRPE